MSGWTETSAPEPISEENKKPFQHLDGGTYKFRIMKFGLEPNQAKTDMKWALEVHVVGTPPGFEKFMNRRLWPGISTKPSAAFMRQMFMHAACPELFNANDPWGPGKSVPENLIGRTLLGEVVIEPHWQDPNKLVNSIKKYYPDPNAVIPNNAPNVNPLESSAGSTPIGFNPIV